MTDADFWGTASTQPTDSKTHTADEILESIQQAAIQLSKIPKPKTIILVFTDDTLGVVIRVHGPDVIARHSAGDLITFNREGMGTASVSKCGKYQLAGHFLEDPETMWYAPAGQERRPTWS